MFENYRGIETSQPADLREVQHKAVWGYIRYLAQSQPRLVEMLGEDNFEEEEAEKKLTTAIHCAEKNGLDRVSLFTQAVLCIEEAMLELGIDDEIVIPARLRDLQSQLPEDVRSSTSTRSLSNDSI